MSELRIALIIIGVIILAGIYVYHQWKSSQKVEKIFSRESEHDDILLSPHADSDLADEGLTDTTAGDVNAPSESASAALLAPDERQEPMLFSLEQTQEIETLQEHNEDARDSDTGSARAPLVMHILAPDDKPFRGALVLKALQASKMRFGEFNIYHRIIDDQPPPRAVFSIAGMVKPGTLNPVELPQMKLPGMTLFLPLPSIIDERRAFDEMIGVAKQMADTLDGVLCNEAFKPLDDKQITSLRQQLSEH